MGRPTRRDPACRFAHAGYGYVLRAICFNEAEVAMQKLNAATAVTAAFAGLALGAGASAAELKILSAGAVQPGLNAAAKIFFDKTGDLAKIAYDPATVSASVSPAARSPISSCRRRPSSRN